MISNKLTRVYEKDSALVDELGYNPYYPEISGGIRDRISIEGRELIDLASNNYLSLSCRPEVVEAMKKALDRYGASMCGTPVATGCCTLYQETTDQLADFLGFPHVLLFPSAYQANNGLFAALATDEDLIVIDHYAHSSLLEGVRAAGCRIWPFLHNNMESLERILSRSARYRNVFVVTESVFSTEGSIAPFDRICSLCESFGAIPVIDDSHGIGVIGEQGRGVLSHFGMKDYQGIYTASLGKAMACSGGLVAGKDEAFKALKYFCSHLIYSTALPPVMLAGIVEVIRILKAEHGQLKDRLDSHTAIIREKIAGLGCSMTDGKAPIVSVITGGTRETLAGARDFYDNGLLVTGFVPPSVPEGQGVLRMIAKAGFSDATVEEICTKLEKLL